MGGARDARPGRVALARVFLLAAIVLMVALAMVAFSSRYTRYLALKAKVASLEREMDRLREENTRLKSEIGILHQPEHIEKLARERLGLAKPGEMAVRMTDPQDPLGKSIPILLHKEGSPPEQKEEKGLSWWKVLWRRIRDRLFEVL